MCVCNRLGKEVPAGAPSQLCAIVFHMDVDEKHEILRHAVATVAYRAARALNGAPESFAEFPGAGRRPDVILAHMGDLFDWALSMAEGAQRWQNSTPLPWEEEKLRFFRAVAAFDTYLSLGAPLKASSERLFQGPVADALTHVGQLAMLRRLAGSPTQGENFYLANIVRGHVGPDQAPPVKTV